METVVSEGTPKRGGDGESPLPVERIGRSLRSFGPNESISRRRRIPRYRERISVMYAVIGG